MIKNLKETKKALQEQGVFYTQPELAEYLKSYIPDGITEIYDPTCGVGGLLSVFPDEVMKYGQDIDGEAIEYAKKHLKNFIGEIGDTLKNPAFMDKKFKYIIANPPFSVKWEQATEDTEEVPEYIEKKYIVQYTAKGKKFVAEYPTITKAAKNIGVTVQTIYRMLKMQLEKDEYILKEVTKYEKKSK